MTFLTGFERRSFRFISFKKLIAQITIRMIGEANESAKLFSVAVLAKKKKQKQEKVQVLSYCLTTTLLLMFREHIYCDLIQIFFSV